MIRILLIGAGAVVEELYQFPLQRLEKAKAVEVLGVVDPNESRGRQIAAKFKRAHPYPDCEAAFRDGSYDLAIIASPPALHAEHACVAFEHGCHVLCEKPMTTTVGDANRMNAAAAKADRTLGVAYPRRFYSNFADVARLVANGELGDDLEFTYREGAPMAGRRPPTPHSDANVPAEACCWTSASTCWTSWPGFSAIRW
ncbi:Gfo/Idh/MocA family protein [Mycolicibacterium psychrotolerans]|uniref:Gfo/Idh/MocA family protein n=1 Tax=Mycolicibacterium psychrotolerans TaxID=216929 RepID=UPI003D67C9F7